MATNLTNEELSAYLSTLSIAPYKSNFQRWWHIFYSSYAATSGRGLPAFLAWCEQDTDLIDHKDKIISKWDEMDAPKPKYSIEFLAKELSKQGHTALQERITVLDGQPLHKLVATISQKNEVIDVINKMASLDDLTEYQRYETFKLIKARTELPMHLLESMFDEAKGKAVLEHDDWPELAVTRTGRKIPNPNFVNFKYFCKTRGFEFIFNEMTQETEIHCRGEVVEEYVLRDAMIEVELKQNKKSWPAIVNRMLEVTKPYHPVKQWLGDDEWDKVDRLPLLIEKLNSPRCPDDLLRIYLTRWMLGGIGAIYNDEGTLHQSVLVLYGPTGCGKTNFFESIIPERYLHQWVAKNIRHPWLVQEGKRARRCWLTELTHIERLIVYGKVKRAKSDYNNRHLRHYLDTNYDKFNRKYILKRSFMCAGITTHDEYIGYVSDSHFLVVYVKDVKIFTEFDCKQLWLQIKHLYDMGQRHELLKSERERHLKFANIMSTRPDWVWNQQG